MDTTTIDPEQRIERLDEHECWRRLLSNQLGRLAFSANGRIEVVPINYVVRARRLLFRTDADASMLQAQRGSVPFEIDGWGRRSAWSVVARGPLTVDPDPAALALESEIGLAPWAPDERGGRTSLLALTVDEVTGREFHRRVDAQERWFW